MWGLERNDQVAKNMAETIGGHIETRVNGFTIGASNMSLRESRGRARFLIVACHLSVMNPIARWINLRNKLIDCWVQSTRLVG